MIKVTGLSNKKHEFFQNYHDFCEHINRIEGVRTLEPEGEGWRFTYVKYATLLFVYGRFPNALEEVFTFAEKEAFENRVGVVEILRGDKNNVTQIPFMSHFDMESLKKNWCLDYCWERGYTVFERKGSTYREQIKGNRVSATAQPIPVAPCHE